MRPNSDAAERSWSQITPGSIVAVIASGSIDRILLKCREVSMTSPSPIALPATEVPPPRETTDQPRSFASASSSRTSSTLRGSATASGSRR